MLESRLDSAKKYDLEERTLRFSKCCLEICKLLERNRINGPLIDQLIRSATSVGANYREANESLTKKEFYYRLNVCRKEAKESKYWLELLQYTDAEHGSQIGFIVQEALELVRIFSSIVLRQKS